MKACAAIIGIALVAIFGGCPTEPATVGDQAKTPLTPGIYSGTASFRAVVAFRGDLVTGDASRLLPTDTLRQACIGFLQTDSDIQALLSRFEQERLAGNSEVEVQASVLSECGGATPCLTCGTLLARQIFDIPRQSEQLIEQTTPDSLVIGEDGLPQLGVNGQVGAVVIRGAIISVETDDGVVVQRHRVEVDLIDNLDGLVVLTMVGEAVDTFRQIESGLTYESRLVAAYDDALGGVSLDFSATGSYAR